MLEESVMLAKLPPPPKKGGGWGEAHNISLVPEMFIPNVTMRWSSSKLRWTYTVLVLGVNIPQVISPNPWMMSMLPFQCPGCPVTWGLQVPIKGQGEGGLVIRPLYTSIDAAICRERRNGHIIWRFREIMWGFWFICALDDICRTRMDLRTDRTHLLNLGRRLGFCLCFLQTPFQRKDR